MSTWLRNYDHYTNKAVYTSRIIYDLSMNNVTIVYHIFGDTTRETSCKNVMENEGSRRIFRTAGKTVNVQSEVEIEQFFVSVFIALGGEKSRNENIPGKFIIYETCDFYYFSLGCFLTGRLYVNFLKTTHNFCAFFCG